MTEAAYGFERTPVASGSNTVNASNRNEQIALKERVAILEKDIADLKKAVDMLTKDLYRQK